MEGNENMQDADELKRLELETKKELYLKKKEQDEKAKQEQENQAAGESGEPHGPEIRFEVRLGAKDLWKFSMYHALGGMKGVFNLMFTGVALFLLAARWGELTAAYRLLLAVCALIFPVWQPILLYSKARKQAKLPAMQKPMILTFSGDGLKVEQNGQQVKFTWEQMGRMDRLSSMIVLYMDRVHAYLLPDSVMGEQKEQFCEMARTYLKPNQRRKI